MIEKKCFKCGEIKDISEFYKHGEMADGHLNKCKECTKKDVKDNYKANISHYVEYEKERSMRTDRREQAKKYQRKRRIKSREKYIARTMVRNAKRDGWLKRMPCEVCGEEKSQAHHDDYSKPLDVRWLCFKHHRELHGQTTH